MIMTTAPGSSDDVAGSSPNRTPSTWAGVATMRTSTSAPVAACEIEVAGFTPSSARRRCSSRIYVICGDVVPCARHIAGHRKAHRAQADPTYSAHRSSFLSTMPAQDSKLLRRDLSHRGDRFTLQHTDVVADIRQLDGQRR